MEKIFVLRTEACLASPKSTMRFGSDNTIVIPLAILQNLYRYEGLPKKQQLAVQFIEYINKLPLYKLLDKDGFIQDNGSAIRIVDNGQFSDEVARLVDFSQLDKRVFQVCLDLQKEGKKVVLISRNPNIRLKARQLGIEAQLFKDEIFPEPSQQYKGYRDLFCTQREIDRLFKDGELPITAIYGHEDIEWIENMFVTLTSESSSAIGRFTQGKIVKLMYSTTLPGKYRALNAQQRMLWECLLAPPEVAPLVVVKGVAGTGKTYCSLGAALENLRNYVDGGIYNQILVASPTVTVSGEELGFLPGDIENKAGPYLGGIMDNLVSIFRQSAPESNNVELEDRARTLFDQKFIKIQPIGFLRGRTIPYTVFIIDETQNIAPGDIQDIVTRAAVGSKFIFLGDPDQVNKTGLSSRYNGLVYLSEKMKGQPLCWQVTLARDKSIRGALAQVALTIL